MNIIVKPLRKRSRSEEEQTWTNESVPAGSEAKEEEEGEPMLERRDIG